MQNENAKAQISAAIDTHATWMQKLRVAVVTGRLEVPASELARDDRCDFGHWLTEVAPGVPHDRHLSQVRELHRAFHIEAGRVARLIDEGDRPTAGAALEDHALLMALSRELVLALTQWRAEI